MHSDGRRGAHTPWGGHCGTFNQTEAEVIYNHRFCPINDLSPAYSKSHHYFILILERYFKSDLDGEKIRSIQIGGMVYQLFQRNLVMNLLKRVLKLIFLINVLIQLKLNVYLMAIDFKLLQH